MRQVVSTTFAITVVALGAPLGLACSGKDGLGAGSGRMWTERQAESISVVRGMRVHVRHCRGLGREREVAGKIVYPRFSCLAGARIAGQPIDTVAITYILRPLDRYHGPSSKVVLTNVRFKGFGVP